MNIIPFPNKKNKSHKLSASSDESNSFNKDNKLILTHNSIDEPEKDFRTATGHRKSVFNQRFFNISVLEDSNAKIIKKYQI